MKAIVLVGSAGAGKSTYARNLAAAEPGKYVIIERDIIRRTHGFPPVGSNDQERFVTKVQNSQIEAALLDGFIPIVANTNTNKGIRKSLIRQLHKYGADVEIKVVHPDLNTVLKQNASRENPVPENIVRKMWQSLESQKGEIESSYPFPRFVEYKHADDKSFCVSVDIDGTVADSVGIRSPYDYTKVHLDKTHDDVIEVVRALGTIYPIVFVSGRKSECREQTEAWIDENITEDYELFMRKDGDERPDFVIKSEIYDHDIFPRYNVLVSLDDRDSVLRHIRNRGVTVMQTNYGRF